MAMRLPGAACGGGSRRRVPPSPPTSRRQAPSRSAAAESPKAKAGPSSPETPATPPTNTSTACKPPCPPSTASSGNATDDAPHGPTARAAHRHLGRRRRHRGRHAFRCARHAGGPGGAQAARPLLRRARALPRRPRTRPRRVPLAAGHNPSSRSSASRCAPPCRPSSTASNSAPWPQGRTRRRRQTHRLPGERPAHRLRHLLHLSARQARRSGNEPERPGRRAGGPPGLNGFDLSRVCALSGRASSSAGAASHLPCTKAALPVSCNPAASRLQGRCRPLTRAAQGRSFSDKTRGAKWPDFPGLSHPSNCAPETAFPGDSDP